MSEKIILDPFMGSGTTLGEVAKLGAKPVGCDINPISTFTVTQALTRTDRNELIQVFSKIEHDVKNELSHFYTTIDPETGEIIPVLYFFWVKTLETPEGENIPLFSSYVFSKDAYPKKKPTARIICPRCWEINTGRYDTEELTCLFCDCSFNAQIGPVQGCYVSDESGKQYEIKALLTSIRTPPKHRLYALLALRSTGEKVYLAPREYDLTLFQQAKDKLSNLNLPLPTLVLQPQLR